MVLREITYSYNYFLFSGLSQNLYHHRPANQNRVLQNYFHEKIQQKTEKNLFHLSQKKQCAFTRMNPKFIESEASSPNQEKVIFVLI